jgi:hypothetical protein
VEALVDADHRQIDALFQKAARASPKDASALGQAALHLAAALRRHFLIKRTRVYPPLYECLPDAALIIEAEIEMDLGEQVLLRLEGTPAHDETFQPMMNILGAWVERHFEQERSRLFPLARRVRAPFASQLPSIRECFSEAKAAAAQARSALAAATA